MSQENSPETEKINPIPIENEMQKSYLDYSMSVIIGRALPNAKDGLKPVHRRILYAMNEMGMFHNKPFKKSARIVGEVLGKYHPHGDTSVYDSLVRMAQPFSMRCLLIDGQGNFGSMDGDSAAAMRYTEARLTKEAEEILKDIEKETVDFSPNFDGSLKEPVVLPSKLPNLMINGSSGIAVGMATNIPPHNLSESVDAITAQIDNPGISINELMEKIPGPDFPTGGIICGNSGIKQAYIHGKGLIKIKARSRIEEHKIIIEEIPYQVNKSQLIEQIADLVRKKVISGISDLRDESDREGVRVVIELKKSSSPDVILNQILKHTRMQITFGVNMLALVNNEPRVLNLKEMIGEHISHRKTIITKRTQFDLKKAQERSHVLEGLIVALRNIDEIIKKIKASRTIGEAKNILIKDYTLSEMQAKAILEMKLQKLASLEQKKIIDEQEELLKLIKELQEILADERKILKIIKDELIEIKEKYGDKRRTRIDLSSNGDESLEIEDLIKDEDMVITITKEGYIKRIQPSTYKQQKRGGKGVIAATKKEDDFVKEIFIASTHSYLLLFTNKGRVHWLKVHEIPEVSRQSKGVPIINLVQIEKDEKISAFIPVKEFKEDEFLIMVTKDGTVKKTKLSAYSNPRKGGIIAITLEGGDNLIEVLKTTGKDEIIIATRDGKASRFSEKDIRPSGRSAKGVRGIKLGEGDFVVDMIAPKPESSVFTITKNGFGKRTKISEYRFTKRGGSGVKNIICSERNGKVVATIGVLGDEDIIIISKNGIVIRTNITGVPEIGRATQGVRIMKLGEGDFVASAAKFVNEDNGVEEIIES